MCGIAGIVTREPWDELPRQVHLMNAVQRHRGPDGDGVWVDDAQKPTLCLGHVRLAILDLSSAGAQPMISACGKHVISYNGEVYNYKEVRRELEANNITFTTRCDTEVVLKALMHWGVEAFRRFNGMWAIAWLDLDRRKMILCRDRFGVKPLYFFHDVSRSRLFFASEIKAILTAAERRFDVNRPVVASYLHQFLLNAQEETFFVGIQALQPGHYAMVDLDNRRDLRPETRAFWRVDQAPPGNGSDKAVGQQMRELFYDAVSLRLRSDVPVGVLVSGGIDSSSIAAAVRGVLGRTDGLNLVTAVSSDARFTEEPFVDALVQHLGARVHKVRLDLEPDEVFRLLETVIWHNDQPISGLSTLAHYLLMERARSLGVTVLLSGQGGDEVLCGYRKYVGFYIQDLIRRQQWTTAIRVLASFARRGSILPQVSFREAKRYLPGARYWSTLRPSDGSVMVDLGLGRGGITARQVADLCRFTVPSLVHYEDRMSMAFAREIRLPFLDYRLVELMVAQSPKLKLKDGWTKWGFRQAMAPDLPPTIAWRKDKQGFLNPQRRWLKHDLAGRLRQVFSDQMISAELGLVDQTALQSLYERYQSEDIVHGRIHDREIFGPLALEVWMRRFEPYIAH